MKIALGMTLYNNAPFLPEAVESILSQAYTDFHLLMLDDGSSDESAEIARSYAARDRRIRFVRHERRHGMIASWRRAFQLACEANNCDRGDGYFAWASDHDRWHPDWLHTLSDCLDRHRDVVLAYPRSRRIDRDGQIIDRPLREFDTAGIGDVSERWKRICHQGMGAGDMVYGLMRVRALVASGVFRDVLRPDRLLIAELSLRGEFQQVEDVLWFRRETGAPSVDRQRKTLFGVHPPPRTIDLPPSLQHASALYSNYIRVDPGLGISRAAMLGMIARYTRAYSVRHFRKSALRYRWGLAIDGLYWIKKRLVRAVNVTVYHALVSEKAARSRAGQRMKRAISKVRLAARRVLERR